MKNKHVDPEHKKAGLLRSLGKNLHSRLKLVKLAALPSGDDEPIEGVGALKTLPAQAKTEEVTFSDLLALWLETNQVRRKGATQRKYQHIIDKHINPELGTLPISKITAVQINQFLKRKVEEGRLNDQGGLSASYVETMAIVIQSAIHFGVEEQLCLPLRSKIYHPPVRAKELHILSRTDQYTLEKELFSRPSLTGCGILMSLRMGLRIGEVCALQWRDVDRTAALLHVRHTISRVNLPDSAVGSQLILSTPKTVTSTRTIPIPEALNRLLLELGDHQESDFFLSSGSDFLSPRTYEYRYHRILDTCGIKPVNYHALRHTFATRCVESGMDSKTLSELLGHADVSITLRVYVHSSMDRKRQEIEKVK